MDYKSFAAAGAGEHEVFHRRTALAGWSLGSSGAGTVIFRDGPSGDIVAIAYIPDGEAVTDLTPNVAVNDSLVMQVVTGSISGGVFYG